jgi:hypothetical protein
MKRILFLLALLCLEKGLHAQYVYTIKADSVKITNTCDTAELIIENHTQTVPGFLFNKGGGRTEFRKISQFDDSTVVIGGDTIHLGRGYKNFANADLTFDGDHWHDGALHNVSLYDFNEIDLQTNDSNSLANTDLKINPTIGYNLSVSNNNGTVDERYNISSRLGNGYASMLVSGRKSGLFAGSQMQLEKTGWILSNSATNFQTGETYNGDLLFGYDSNLKNAATSMSVQNGLIKIFTMDNRGATDRWLDFKLHNADSITLSTVTHFDTITRYTQTREGFVFKRLGNNNNFRILGLPASTSTTDSMLVIDNSGQVKKRPQAARKSAAVTADAYTVPADVDVVFVNYTGGTATITLPTGTLDREITIKNMNSTYTLALSGLDPSESNTIANHGAITVKYTGSVWVGISKY